MLACLSGKRVWFSSLERILSRVQLSFPARIVIVAAYGRQHNTQHTRRRTVMVRSNVMEREVTIEKKQALPVMVENGISKLDVDQLDAGLKAKVLALDAKVKATVKGIGHQQLALGKLLFELQQLLHPLKLFTLYLNTLPWFSIASAYRYIEAYKKAGEMSPALAEQAIASGVPLFGTTKDKPFGKLTEAVRAMPDPPRDEEGASRWLAELKVKQIALRFGTRKDDKLTPIERLALHIFRVYDNLDDQPEFKVWWRELSTKVEALVKEPPVRVA